jgi:hypothetical protein
MIWREVFGVAVCVAVFGGVLVLVSWLEAQYPCADEQQVILEWVDVYGRHVTVHGETCMRWKPGREPKDAGGAR